MLTIPSKPEAASALGLTLMLLLLLAPAAVSRAQEEAGGGPPRSALAAFEALYVQVTEAVAEGRLPAGAGEQADELAFGLKKALIQADAEIEVYKLEAARYSGSRQEEALDGLVAAAAAREWRTMLHLRRLEKIAGMPADLSALPAGLGAAEASDLQAEEEEADAKERGTRIRFEPEDPTESGDP